jgi:tetratricopeptide (TPR) repeat protein
MQQQPTCRPGDAGMRQDAGMASLLNRLERELHAAATARPRDAARYAGALEQAVQACQTNPAAAELFELTDLYLELTTAYEQLGHYDDALTTVDAVIAAGIKMQPDSRCLRAETLMRAGRVAEAEPIWTAVLADSPDDVWLYNNAGLEYADVGEHAVALHWLTEGLRLALRTGDPERPEDCGGPGGYAELLATLADPADPEHERMRTWVGNRLRPFDRAAIDQRVRQVVGAVPESVRLLLGFVADGVKLTPVGRLPRRIVRQMQQHRPQWYPLGRPASIEEDLWPLSELHDLLRRVGLLRLRHGVLSPTRAAGDDLAAMRRLRSAFEPGAFDTEITILSVGALAADGPLSSERLAARVFPLLGRGWRRGGQPLTEGDVRSGLIGQCSVMEALDLIDRGRRDVWTLGRSARSLLPGAAMLAEVWGNGDEEL